MKYTYKDNKEMFCELRDRITKESISVYYDSFNCGAFFFTIRICLLDGKMFLVKRCNKRCVEIVDLSEDTNDAYLEANDKNVSSVEKKESCKEIFEDEDDDFFC